MGYSQIMEIVLFQILRQYLGICNILTSEQCFPKWGINQ